MIIFGVREKSIMVKNNGEEFEKIVYLGIRILISQGEFFINAPYMKLFRKKGYYSFERKKNIITDISIEIYIKDPIKYTEIKPIIIECKDYSKALPVDDVEEFHAKLQQIGADNTKGIIITRHALYQEGAINYAKSKGIMIMDWEKYDQVAYCYSSIEEIDESCAFVSDIVI